MRQMSAALQRLFERRQVGVKFSLEGIKALCEALGNPHHDLSFVHIAGTNGKGSVAAMCASIFQEAGLRTGLYTSPHLVRYNERFRFDGKEILDEPLDSLLKQVMDVAGDETTFFEISTALALCWFREKKTQMVVWETGLGGRLDATNLVVPSVSVITSIGLDHTQFLGTTFAQIAFEKAGIIKPSVPVVIGMQNPEVMTALKREAENCNAPLTIVGESDLDAFESPLAGEHQRWNTAIAIAACRLAHPSVGNRTIAKGLKQTNWVGRCQVIERGNGLAPILLDGAHNPLGAYWLAREIERRWGIGKVTLIFGALADKDIPGMLNHLLLIASRVIFTPVASERSIRTEEFSHAFSSALKASSFSEALSVADQLGQPIVISGSLFLIGEAIALLNGKKATNHPNEYFQKVIPKRME